MPLTTLDPAPALIVIDLRNGIVAGSVASVVPNATALAKAFRERDGHGNIGSTTRLPRAGRRLSTN
ncbi:MAG TPA: hypothetical protein VJ914_32060 [Pseudonocardiaceae bacterium]|nr:hypothetical protein [Pseudonocardiaceae bacterium]